MRTGIDHQPAVILSEPILPRQILMTIARQHAGETSKAVLGLYFAAQVSDPLLVQFQAVGLGQVRPGQHHFQTRSIVVGLPLRGVHHKQAVGGDFSLSGAGDRPDELLVWRAFDNLPAGRGKPRAAQATHAFEELPFELRFERVVKARKAGFDTTLHLRGVAIAKIQRGDQSQSYDRCAQRGIHSHAFGLLRDPGQ